MAVSKNDRDKIISTNNKLIEASSAYYNGSEIMSNYECDKLYDELVKLESKTGFSLSNSVTKNVGYKPTSSGFATTRHEHKMLSLRKTKSIDDIRNFMGERECCLSWKLDGLTVVLTYEDGFLKKAATRGDGVVGDDITEQARLFSNIPNEIPYKDKLIVRGEALISYDEFERIKKIEGCGFKNPRNLASGTVKSVDLSVLKNRLVSFVAFTLVDTNKLLREYNKQLDFLNGLGFETVDYVVTDVNSIDIFLDLFTKASLDYDYPVDGLVLYYNEISAHRNVGATSHHPNYALAYKWSDSTKETCLRNIEWHKSRTGRINPVAVFDPVELEGSTVSRASLHNLSYIEDMKLGIGDCITVYKANMIIPQIAENLDKSLENIEEVIPRACPNCGGHVSIVSDGSSSFLKCNNPNCFGSAEILHLLKNLKIKGLADSTLDKLYECGIISSYLDVFDLSSKREEALKIDGIGERKLDDIISKLNDIRVTKAEYLSALGIEGVGKRTAEIVLDGITIEELSSKSAEELCKIHGVGEVVASNIENYFKSFRKLAINGLLPHVKIVEEKSKEGGRLSGCTFAITGKLNEFNNRSELEKFILTNGGNNSSVVTKDVTYLVSNDLSSNSSKLRKAKDLGIRIISEKDLLSLAS